MLVGVGQQVAAEREQALVAALDGIAADNGIKTAQLAIAWALHKWPMIVPGRSLIPSCTVSTDCSGSTPVCSYGYCEAQ